MSWENYLLLSVLLLLFFLPVALLAAEQQYLITETQLQSIEKFLAKLETDRRNWESQAAGLRNEAASLNDQLRQERERYKTLEISYNKSEASRSEQITRLSSEAAAERAEKKRYKRSAANRLVWIIALVSVVALFLVYKVYRFFRPLKLLCKSV